MLKQTGLCFLVGALGAAACGSPSDTDYTGTPGGGHATSGGSSGSAGTAKGGSSASGGSGGSSKGGSGGSSKGGTGGGATGGSGGMAVGGTTDVGGSGGTDMGGMMDVGGADVGGSGGSVGGSSGDAATGGMTTGGAGMMTGGTGSGMGGAGGKGGKGGKGGSGGGPSCDELATAYATALDAAKVCDPNSGKDQCTELVRSSLVCGCNEYANPDNESAIADLTQLRKEGIMCMQVCPAIACPAPEQGTCQQDPDGGEHEGHCVSAGGPLPLR